MPVSAYFYLLSIILLPCQLHLGGRIDDTSKVWKNIIKQNTIKRAVTNNISAIFKNDHFVAIFLGEDKLLKALDVQVCCPVCLE